MHNVLIIEDDITQCNLLKNTLSSQYPVWTIQTAYNFSDAKELIQNSITLNKPYSFFLFDIQLTKEEGDRGGFFLAKEVRKHSIYYKTPILFLTAISDEGSFALSEFHCYNYITKPYTTNDILQQIEQMLITGYIENSLELSDINRVYHKIQISDIYTIESKSHTLIFHTFHGDFITREYTLEKILNLLNNDLIQCHRRILINKSHIFSYDKSMQYIKIGNCQVPVGRTYIKNVENYTKIRRL